MRLSSSGRILSLSSRSASSSSKSLTRSDNRNWKDDADFRKVFEGGQVLGIGLCFDNTNVFAGIKHTAIAVLVRSKKIGWNLDGTPMYECKDGDVIAVFDFNKDGREWILYATLEQAQQERNFNLIGFESLTPPVSIDPMFTLCNEMPMYDVLEFNCRNACKTLLHHFNVTRFDSEIVLVSEVINDVLGV